MVIDPTTNVGKLRLRIGDYLDPVLLPDEVYTQTLADTVTLTVPNGDLPRASKTIALYILAILSQRTHEKLGQVEVWGGDAAKSYKDFLLMTFANPNFMSISPIPYGAGVTTLNPLMQFSADWNAAYSTQTASDQLHLLAQLPQAII